MKRPSRGERRSATTTRQTGSFFPPTRVSLMLTATGWNPPSCARERRNSLALPHELAEVGHLALREAPHHLAHLVELLDQLIDLLDGHARPLGDPHAPRALDHLGVTPLVRRHREDDRLHAVELALVDLHLRQLVAGQPGDHLEQ